jgi:hypothetical protein
MRTNESDVPRVSAAGAATARQGPPRSTYRVRGKERLLRELLAEAHARIRALEEALDRVKKAAV